MAKTDGRRVRESSETIKVGLHQARMALYEAIWKIDPVEKNKDIKTAFEALEAVMVSTEEIREICIKAAVRGSYKDE